MKMIIREATSKDLKYVAKLNFELDKYEKRWYPYPNLNLKNSEKWLKKSFPGKKIFVAIDNKKIVGYSFGWIETRFYHNKVKKYVYCSDLFVLKEYRRKGIGKKLIKKFEDFCRKKGLEYLQLSTNFKNKIGKKIYPSIGFKECEIMYVKRIR